MNFLIKLKELKNNFYKRENIFFLVIILLVFIFDRITKLMILNNFSERSYYINDYINLELIWNTGIGFGLLSSSSILIYHSISIIIGIIILAMLIVLINSEQLIEKTIFSIIIGGACGNIYDRLIYNAVPDFIDVHYKTYHWPTFNMADSFIFIGVVLFIYNELIILRGKKNV